MTIGRTGHPSIVYPRPPRGVMLDVHPGASVMADRGVLGIPKIRALSAPETPRIGTEAFERLLDQQTQSVSRPGNRVRLLPDGKTAFAARDQMFADAPGDIIHQQTFVSNSDEVGWHNAAQLSKHAKTATARHVFDPIGSFRSVRDGGRIFRFMRSGGVHVAPLHESALTALMNVNRLNHQKMLLRGVECAIGGGINIGDMYANNGVAGNGIEGVMVEGKRGTWRIVGWEKPYKLIDFRAWWSNRKVVTYKQPWHDMDLKIEGPVCADFQRAFIRTWLQTGRAMEPTLVERLTNPKNAPFFEDGVNVRFIDHRPIEDGDDYITAAIVRHIEAARDSVVLETPYFSPPRVIRDALCAAARRGVRVEVLTNSRDAINHKIAYDAGHGMYRELLEAGVKILEKTPMVHGKFIVVDDRVTLGGSANLNGRTRYQDAETLIVVNSEELARETRSVIEAQCGRCNVVTLNDLGGLGTRIRDGLASLVRRYT